MNNKDLTIIDNEKFFLEDDNFYCDNIYSNCFRREKHFKEIHSCWSLKKISMSLHNPLILKTYPITD